MNLLKNILFFLTFVIFFTNDGERKFLKIDLYNFSLIERDIFLLLLYFIFITLLFTKNKKLKSYNFSFFLFNLTIMYIAGTLLGFYFNNNLKNIFWHLRQFIYILIYFPFIYIINSKFKLTKYLRYLIHCGFISSIFSIILFLLFWDKQVYFRSEFFYSEWLVNFKEIPRIITGGSYWAPLILIILSSIFIQKKEKKHYSKIYFFIPLFIFISLLISFSRSLWIEFVVSSMFFILFSIIYNLEKNKIIILFMVFMIIFTTFIFILIPQKIISFSFYILDMQNITSSPSYLDRKAEHFEIIEKVKESPLFGLGLGAEFELNFLSFGEYIETKFTHNSYLNYLQNFGLTGLVFLLLNFYILIRKMHKMLRFVKNEYLYVYTAVISYFYGMLVCTFFYPEINSTSGFFRIGIMLGLMESLVLFSRGN